MHSIAPTLLSRKPFRLAALSFAALLALIAAAGCLLAENALHVRHTAVSQLTAPAHQDAQIRTPDGADLHAWLFLPARPHPNYVIVLHGVGDTRAGMRSIAAMLLHNGYAVLAPDSRGHGESTGEPLTYGIREAHDVHQWADYLYRTQQVENLYGLGESMGAAILLESLPIEPRFRAVVAECPFSSFTAIAHDRIYQAFQSDSWPVRAAAAPTILFGFLYARLRYGIDLTAASPIEAVRHVTTPILLIHGLHDTNIPPQHSRDLLFANPRHIVPWFVPKAGHVGAFSANRALFEQRVVSFFQSYS
jgi:dipeptidyl aminopeptidase/acylaminoacyl peptidase